MSNLVTVACNLPRGMICEVGLELDYQLQRFVHTPKYRRVALKGSQAAALLLVGGDTNRYVPRRGSAPGLTEGVDREFIETWLREHPRLAQHVWIVDSPKDLKHQIADRPAAPFEPLDPTQKMTINGNMVEAAKFTDAPKEPE